MDISESHFLLWALLFISLTALLCAQAQETASLQLNSEAEESAMTVKKSLLVYTDDLGGEEDEDRESSRRSMFWNRVRFYISYGALSADRVPCPPRSGRSYYTHNCYFARGPVHPYIRSCSAVTRCRIWFEF